MDPSEAAITLPLSIFNIFAAANQLDKVHKDFIREQCNNAVSAYREHCSSDEKAAFQAYCELAGENPFKIGVQTYQKYISTVSRPPPQSAFSECDDNDARQQRIPQSNAEADAEAEAFRLEKERIAREKAAHLEKERIRIAREKAAQLEKERIAKEKVDAARLERERRKREQLAAAKAAAEYQYTNEAIEKRISDSADFLEKRLNGDELNEDGPKFHPIEVDLPDAHNQSVVNVLFNEEGHDAEECIVQLGEACVNVLQLLRPKRIIIGQVRDSEIEKIREDAPDIDEGAGMGEMLAVLESKDGQSDDDSITNAAKDCITLAVEHNVLEKKGSSPRNWFIHYSSFGHEYKAAIAKCIGLFSLMTVASKVFLEDVIDSNTMGDAKVLAESRGYYSLDGLTLGQYTFLIGAPSILGNIETEMEMVMGVICEGFLRLLNNDFVETWRQYGDKIMLPDEDGVIRFSETAPDYFSDTMKGAARKTGVVLNLLTVFQSPIIASLHSGDVGNLDGKQLAQALLRCPTSDIVTKTKLLKQGDLLFSQNTKKVSDAKKFLSTHLEFLLKKSKGRAEIYLKYCIFLDLRQDIHKQLELLLKVLHRSDLEPDLLQRFVQYSFD